jgi:hypothetical protein
MIENDLIDKATSELIIFEINFVLYALTKVGYKLNQHVDSAR